MSLLALLASITCLAVPVENAPGGQKVVRAGPFMGLILPRYDVVEGRFRLHVGSYRVPGRLAQKIGWVVTSRDAVGGTLTVTGRSLSAPERGFTQRFQRIFGPGITRPSFATVISPPSAGCWRLTFRSGSAVGSLKVLVRS